MLMSIRLDGRPGVEILVRQREIAQKRLRNFNNSNFKNPLIQCHMNDDGCLVFVDLYHPQIFEVITYLK